MKIRSLIMFGLMIFSAFIVTANADDDVHKVVIQVSTDDPRTQKIAINNAVNIQKAYGAGNVIVEVVAYGPGLSILTSKSKQGSRVKGLALDEDFTFSACNNTMKKIERKKGKKPVLVEGVTVVPSGVTRIMELQEKDYSYLRP